MANEWIERWREGRIAFHLPETHPQLERHWSALDIPPGDKVLVPLCGKSLDMRWLADRGHPVLGIEFASEAIEQFVAEGDGEVSRYRQGYFDVWRQGSVEIWCGDFFHLHIDNTREIQAFYDRAALIALQHPARQRYAFHLAQLLPPGAKGLMITITRSILPEKGPPYNVEPEEVRQLFTPNFELELLDVLPADDRGFSEHVWSLVRRGPSEG
ncbi:thiopurine S-methyltransferase [Modicisalibacter ilicicola DSM 19980]|uniref:Thiopurine S-methyltransferase n=1 Tax=Modicisalibacter ilicicola DSM 19980 TaxID=1121942 RepID=A0A1M4X346_9GAMM|nr:thiopurine S-methyltransferase [Halomonas ilicicola]SHE87928.1 thiopurine S-methyltransferase [Halomonas ilicicola DSM 19980]